VFHTREAPSIVPAVRTPAYLKPATTLAERVLLPDDPHRALAIAQAVLEGPLMFNHHFGLWGYTGTAADGAPLTVQSSGIGGASAAIVVGELVGLGARRFVRIGRCHALVDTVAEGDDLAVVDALDQTCARTPADVALNDNLLRAGIGKRATVVSTDRFYETRGDVIDGWRAAGAHAVDLESEAVLRAAGPGAAACLLRIAGRFPIDGDRPRLSAEETDEIALAQARIALVALA